MSKRLAAVILAAGQGPRMKSSLPKILHRVVGLPMVLWSVQSAQVLGADPVVLVVGNGAEAVKETVGDGVLYAHQAERLGTGHAALQARSLLQGNSDWVLILYGDMPNLSPETLRRLVALHEARQPAVTILSVLSDDAMGFGRIVRDREGEVKASVEEAVATPEVLAIKELNCGVYCFEADWLWQRLPDVRPTPPKDEYYLPDMIALAIEDGRPLEVLTINDVAEVQGVNTRVHLARSERILRERINERIMLGGVTLIDPDTTYIEPDVEVGPDTVIYPNTCLQGNTVVGRCCTLGPNAVLRGARIGANCRVAASVLEGTVLGDGESVGPFEHLGGARLSGRGEDR